MNRTPSAPRGQPVTPGVLAALATTVFLWASLFVATRAAVPYYGPTHLTLLRFLVASLSFGVVLLVVHLVSGRTPRTT